MSDYAPIPFWFLNHRLEKEEITRQLKLMKQSGVSGFFAHPRAGLLTPYGSDEWFSMMVFIAEESEKLGLQMWLYDEDPFPSGAAGGRVFFENPEYRAKALMCRKITPKADGMIDERFGQVHIINITAVQKDSAGNILNTFELTSEAGVLREEYHKSSMTSSYYCDWYDEVEFPHYRAETFYPQMALKTKLPSADFEVYVCYADIYQDSDKYGFVPDNLNESCVRRFIELTHEKYKAFLGKYFGKTVPGIFTDEPKAGGILPFTDMLFDTFTELFSYDLHPLVYHLFVSVNERSREIRRHYWLTVNHLYKKAFFNQISDWCKVNGIKLAGHVIAEEDPVNQVFTGGSAFTYMKYFDIPGFDIICDNLGNQERPALMFGAKLISSAAHKEGKKKVLCEAMACNPFNFGPAEMKRMTDWLYAMGITVIVPHGFHYSYDGHRKFDAGKSFFFQDEYFDKFPEYARYTDKTGRLLAGCRHLCNTAVLYPISKFFELFPAEEEAANSLRKTLDRAVACLFANQIEFDILDEESFDSPVFGDGYIVSGEERFKNVVFFCPDDERRELLEQNGVSVYTFYDSESFDIELLKQNAVSTSVQGSNTENIIVYLKQFGDKKLRFIFNNSPYPSDFEICGEAYQYVYDQLAESYSKTDGKILLNGYQSIILVESAEEIADCAQYNTPLRVEKTEYECDKKPKLDFPVPSACAELVFWDITAGEYKFEHRHFIQIRNLIGTEMIDPVHKRIRPGNDQALAVKSPYPVKAVFKADFCLEVSGKQRYLLIEGDTIKGDFRIELNGHPLKKEAFKPYFVYDFTNAAADISELVCEGLNHIFVIFENAGEFDGLCSSIYVI